MIFPARWRGSLKTSGRRMVLWLMLGGIFADPFSLWAQTEPQPESSSQPTDSVKLLRKQYSGKKAWEHWVSLPGTVLSIPFVVFLKGVEYGAGYIYESNLIPRTLDLLTSRDGRRQLYPTYSNRSGPGIEYTHKGIIGGRSRLSLRAAHGFFTQRQHYRFRWRRVHVSPAHPLFLNFELRYRFLPQEKFYGIGADTKRSEVLGYDREFSIAAAGIEIPLAKSWNLFGLAHYQHNNIYKNSGDDYPSLQTVYSDTALAGLDTRVKIAQYQMGLAIDTRNRPGNPTSGSEVVFSGSYFHDVGGDDFNFWKAQGEFRQYLHLGHNRVLSLRLALEISEPVGNGRIPFYYLSELGEVETIRGYNRGRFRDEDMALASLEYAIPLWYRIDSFLFMDAGQIAKDMEKDFSWKQVQLGFGGGIKVRDSQDVIAILQIGVSREIVRVYLDLY